jgi:hypothetical protein
MYQFISPIKLLTFVKIELLKGVLEVITQPSGQHGDINNNTASNKEQPARIKLKISINSIDYSVSFPGSVSEQHLILLSSVQSSELPLTHKRYAQSSARRSLSSQTDRKHLDLDSIEPSIVRRQDKSRRDMSSKSDTKLRITND